MKTLTLLFVFLAAACGADSSNVEMEEALVGTSMMEEDVSIKSRSSFAAAPTESQSSGNQASGLPLEKKIIKNGGVSYQVTDTKQEYQQMLVILKQYDAYISSENESKGYDRINYNVDLKVPPQNFEQLISALVKEKTVENKWVNSNDVTARYYDLDARIANKKKLEERYQQILKQASNVRDILEVERNLNQVRSDIESLQGQFKLLSNQINYSSLSVSFYELIPYEREQEARPGFVTRIVNALSGGWSAFLSFLVILVRLWPFAILIALLIPVVRKLRGRKKINNQKP